MLVFVGGNQCFCDRLDVDGVELVVFEGGCVSHSLQPAGVVFDQQDRNGLQFYLLRKWQQILPGLLHKLVCESNLNTENE